MIKSLNGEENCRVSQEQMLQRTKFVSLHSQDILFHTFKMHSECVSHQQPEISHSEISYHNRNMFIRMKEII
jgi:hypothetical protein